MYKWTTELKDRRIPTVYQDGKKLGHWKAEEFAKLILVAPVVLRNLVPQKAYNCFCLLRKNWDLVHSRLPSNCGMGGRTPYLFQEPSLASYYLV